MLPSKRDATRIIHRLGESGQPPTRGVQYFNVGNTRLLDTLTREYLESYLKEGGSSFKLVVGQYGGGKTHLMFCLRELAWKHGFATSFVQLSQKECPYDDPLRVYQAVARNIQAPPGDAASEPERGVDEFLKGHYYGLSSRLSAQAENADETGAMLDAFVQSLGRIKVENPSFRNAVQRFVGAVASGDEQTRSSLGSWLQGDELERGELRSFGIIEAPHQHNAFRMLRNLCQLVRELGYQGLILLFDEGQRMVSMMSARSQKYACENLLSVVNHCGDEELPGALFVYSVTPDFLESVVPRYAALHQRLEAPTVFSERNPFSPRIDLDELDLPGEELLVAMGEKILAVFEVYKGRSFDRGLQLANIGALARRCYEQTLSVNQRRVFVKTLVAHLMQQSVDGESPVPSWDAPIETSLLALSRSETEAEAGGEY
ncbi:MAG: DUF2791 family P-loop domain-containing protein [Candidatus Riflebacteria bacterium]|nr:DUF2791 family P-loop domain-containing protein [Candidatus Riflebacteria bacterium]